MNTQIIQPDGNLALVLAALDAAPDLADSTRHQYRKAVLNYVAEGHSLTDPQALAGYARTVGSSTRAFLSAAVTKLCERIELKAKSQATPDNVAAVQATVYRAEALRQAVHVERLAGQKAHTWLTQTEVKQLLDTCEADVVGQRDRLALGLLLAAGLRRGEATHLTFADVKLQPVKERLRTVLDVAGKGAKERLVPIRDSLANAIGDWAAVVGGDGRILRSLGRKKVIGDSLSTAALYDIVQKRGGLIGKPDLAPHDLRRTYAQLGYEAGIPITQISTLLGHASVETTQRYLNLELDLETTVSDFIPF
jgi:integrase